MSVFRAARITLAAGLVALVGCGGGPRLAQVEGTVKVNGKPLDKIQVEFWPEAGAPRSRGVTDAEGRYTLTSDDGKRKGALVGRHKVVLRDIGILGDKFLGRAGENVDMAKGKRPRVSKLYSDPQNTPLKQEVTSGPNSIDLDVK